MPGNSRPVVPNPRYLSRCAHVPPEHDPSVSGPRNSLIWGRTEQNQSWWLLEQPWHLPLFPSSSALSHPCQPSSGQLTEKALGLGGACICAPEGTGEAVEPALWAKWDNFQDRLSAVCFWLLGVRVIGKEHGPRGWVEGRVRACLEQRRGMS